MAATPEETIRAAAQAYVAGDDEGLMSQLAERARVLGSEQRDNWHGREAAARRLAPELERRRTIDKSVGGSLIEQIGTCEVERIGDEAAWWTASGDLEVDGAYHRETSWTVVLSFEGYSEDSHDQAGGDWKIVHSHFSIHR
ncbi:MAG TPA: nuclear transport factor 2 family protein [Acidimicrobiia bacterium]|nr:nuclear transport factor 2 family protein [Acidimicrobiia bacterium]